MVTADPAGEQAMNRRPECRNLVKAFGDLRANIKGEHVGV
jgi:hypothetical protein